LRVADFSRCRLRSYWY